MAEKDEASPVTEAAPKVKKPYEKPMVEDMGTLAELTAGATGTGADNITVSA